MESMGSRMRAPASQGPGETPQKTPVDTPEETRQKGQGAGERGRSTASVAGAASTPPLSSSPGTATASMLTGSHPVRSPGSRSPCARACAGPADELDHRLAINVARALGPEALRRSFTLENLQWLCQLVPPAQDQARSLSCTLSQDMLAGLERCAQGLETEPCLGGDLSPHSLLAGCRRGRSAPRGRPHCGIGGMRPSETASRGTGMGWIAFPRADRCPGSVGPQKSALRRSCGQVFS